VKHAEKESAIGLGETIQASETLERTNICIESLIEYFRRGGECELVKDGVDQESVVECREVRIADEIEGKSPLEEAKALDPDMETGPCIEIKSTQSVPRGDTCVDEEDSPDSLVSPDSLFLSQECGVSHGTPSSSIPGRIPLSVDAAVE